ncbi:NAD(P)-binding protein [Streptomyces sp. L7]
MLLCIAKQRYSILRGAAVPSAILDPLLQPFRLKHLTLRNRVVSTSHEPAFGEDGMPKDRYRAYHVEKARGGVGLTMIGGSAVVSPDSPPAFGNLLPVPRRHRPRGCAGSPTSVHEAGAAVMCRGHPSRPPHQQLHRRLAPGGVRLDRCANPRRAFPKAAEPWDLDRIVADYASAAVRCREGGLDGIELEAYGHLLDSFLSPRPTTATTRWGGGLENRMAFPRRVIRAVRDAVGPDFIVGISDVAGRSTNPAASLCRGTHRRRQYAADGIDFISTIHGSIERDASGEGNPVHRHPARPVPGLHRRDQAPPLRPRDARGTHRRRRHRPARPARRTARPGRRDPCADRRSAPGRQGEGRPGGPHPALRRGELLPRRDLRLRRHQVRPQPGRRPGTPPAPSRPRTTGHRRKAVVVGAGPAGLEAARVLGERGHDVVLFEASDQPGGQIRLAASNPRRADLIQIVDWRLAECKILGVDLRAGHVRRGRRRPRRTPRPRDRRHRRHAQPQFSQHRRGVGRRHLGRDDGLAAPPARRDPGLRRPRRLPGHGRRGGPHRLARPPDRVRHPGARPRPRRRQHELPCLPAGVHRARRHRHSPGGCAPCAAPGTGGWPRPSTASTRRPRPSGSWTTWSWSTGPCRRTSCTSNSSRVKQLGRGRPPCPAGQRAAVRGPQRGGPPPASSASATPSPPATSTPRSTTRCGCACRSERHPRPHVNSPVVPER